MLQPIEGRSGSDYSAAFGINDLGDIAGAANTATGVRAFRSRRGAASIELAPLSGDTSSGAFGVNLRGEVVGYSSGPNGTRAVIWNPGGSVQALPALSGANWSRAFAINDPGDVVGVSEMPSGPRATLWTARHRAGSRDAFWAWRERGAEHQSERRCRRIFWEFTTTPCRALGSRRRHPKFGDPSRRRFEPGAGISKGEVVGTSETSDGERAFLWTDAGGMQDLNSLLTSRSGFVLTQAVSISRQGIILAVGENDDSHHTHETPLRIFILVAHLKQICVAFSTVTRLAG